MYFYVLRIAGMYRFLYKKTKKHRNSWIKVTKDLASALEVLKIIKMKGLINISQKNAKIKFQSTLGFKTWRALIEVVNNSRSVLGVPVLGGSVVAVVKKNIREVSYY